VGYRYATEKSDYADYSSGHVLRSAPGFPAFPVRLASEVFQRAVALRPGGPPVALWDPCCGSGYLLTVIALLHRGLLRSVLATDIDPRAAELASQNLAMLDPAALIAREKELAARAERFAKPSYLDTAQAAHRLSAELTRQGGPLPVRVREANAFDRQDLAAVVAGGRPDVVLTDIPYGEQTAWLGAHDDAGLPRMLAALAAVLPGDAVLGVTTRGRRVPLGGIHPRETLKVGTRAVALLYAGDVTD
jgi:hypothetical protein